MAEPVTLAAVQPPYLDAGGKPLPPGEVSAAALALLAEAAAAADLVVLPELLNVKNVAPEDAAALAERVPGPLSEQVHAIAARHDCTVLVPLLEERAGRLYNAAHLIGPAGSLLCYDKVHLTRVEREAMGLTPGERFAVAETSCGVVGVMTCYDGHFPESAAVLARLGADVIAYPALERGLTKGQIRLMVAARAWDHAAVVVRASYGLPTDMAWREGLMAGESCIAAKDGTIVASAGCRAGVVTAALDPRLPRLQPRSYGAEAGDTRAFHDEDRRPEAYGPLVRPQGGGRGGGAR